MIWQDYVMAGAQALFIIALLPATRAAAPKPPRFTCFLTALTLLIMALTQMTLGLIYTASATLVMTGMWTGMGLRRR